MALPTPAPAVRYVRTQGTRDRTPAIIWIALALLGLWVLRHGALPTPRQAITGGVGLGAVILVGEFFPRLVFWALLALLFAAVLATPQLVGLLDELQHAGVSLSLNPTANQPIG